MDKLFPKKETYTKKQEEDKKKNNYTPYWDKDKRTEKLMSI